MTLIPNRARGELRIAFALNVNGVRYVRHRLVWTARAGHAWSTLSGVLIPGDGDQLAHLGLPVERLTVAQLTSSQDSELVTGPTLPHNAPHGVLALGS